MGCIGRAASLVSLAAALLLAVPRSAVSVAAAAADAPLLLNYSVAAELNSPAGEWTVAVGDAEALVVSVDRQPSQRAAALELAAPGDGDDDDKEESAAGAALRGIYCEEHGRAAAAAAAAGRCFLTLGSGDAETVLYFSYTAGGASTAAPRGRPRTRSASATAAAPGRTAGLFLESEDERNGRRVGTVTRAAETKRTDADAVTTYALSLALALEGEAAEAAGGAALHIRLRGVSGDSAEGLRRRQARLRAAEGGTLARRYLPPLALVAVVYGLLRAWAFHVAREQAKQQRKAAAAGSTNTAAATKKSQ